ncbi:MAG: GNAT family N-acetyltransferase [Chitinophagales bacterium]
MTYLKWMLTAVHLYIENNPVKSIDEITKVIKQLKEQYIKNGIARWAVVDKTTNECVGWSGLKYSNQTINNHTNFYDLGYRFKRKHWGKGFATESSIAILNYGLEAEYRKNFCNYRSEKYKFKESF